MLFACNEIRKIVLMWMNIMDKANIIMFLMVVKIMGD